ncbi:11238_t:CDS:2, partial [Racocetra persica]
ANNQLRHEINKMKAQVQGLKKALAFMKSSSQSSQYLLATSASMKITEINTSQIISQEYKERTESFIYEKDKKHMFYKSALTMLSDEQDQSCGSWSRKM